MVRSVTALGFLLVVLGGILVIGPTIGFSSVVSDRGVNINTADTDSALLAIQQTDIVVENQNTPEEILSIENNANQDLSLDVEVTIIGGGLEDVDEEGFDDNVVAGDNTTYAVTCEPGSGGGTTDVEVTIYSAIGDGLSITNVSETFTIERDCPGPGGPADPGEPGTGRPDAEDFYSIHQESWTEDREFIFEVNNWDYNVQSVNWDFGDGATSTEQHHQHTYAENGEYDITLTAEVDGEEYLYSTTVVVEDQLPSDDGPPAEEVYEISQADWNDEIYIFTIVHNDVSNADWDLGDGTTMSRHHIQHTYDGSGEYEITLVVTISGEQYIYTDTVDVTS